MIKTPTPLLRKWRNYNLENYDVHALEAQLILKVTWDLNTFNKRLRYVRQMIDLLFINQDVANNTDQLLFNYFCKLEVKMLKDMSQEAEIK